ncbi:DsrE family protein [Mucilaginibacter ginkgonis]|uniref:DsrE family protein n=1 Tax=Mucilaginibacter ginkgonis TaxID=2682091 RepID=A0A6I4I1Q9_9SPHI|nr:DsrE family protein [Mucilaginibacter ginkgonis]QQL48762.1 DsrE family protein [Mucilaginibacter ginkgonis]
MKSLLRSLLVFAFIFAIKPVLAQSSFKGADADATSYKALYYLNSNDEKKIRSTLRNIDNALEDPRLKGKVQIELVVFGDGVAAYDKAGPYEEQLSNLAKKGVILAQCNNTLRERHIDPATLFPFIGIVPSGNGEIIIRHAQGWATIHP